MQVSELIEKLKTFRAGSEVLIQTTEGDAKDYEFFSMKDIEHDSCEECLVNTYIILGRKEE